MINYLFISNRPSLTVTFFLFPIVYLAIVILFDLINTYIFSSVIRFELNLYLIIILVNTWIYRVWTQSDNASMWILKILARAFVIPIFILLFGMTCTVIDDFGQGKISVGNFSYYRDRVIFTNDRIFARK